MTFSNTDSDNLARVAAALERMAAADERRNELLELDQAERRAAWSEALERLIGTAPTSENPWRDLPEHQHG